MTLLWLGIALGACGPTTSTSPTAPPLPTAVIVTRGATPAPSATRAPTIVPSPTPEPQPWRFVVLGDTRTEGLKPPDVTDAIVERAAEARPEITLAVGDLINALNTQTEVRAQWRNWRAAVAPLDPQRAAGVAPWLLVTPGNHDVQGHAWATDLLVEAFPELPANGPSGYKRRAYALAYRDVQFISIDSESFAAMHRLGDAQLDWLEARLRDHPSRYTIVFSHDPAYPVGPHVGSSLDAYPRDRDRLWRLLRDYHVGAYIAGHEHLYNHRQIEGVHQIIAGTSGSFVYAGYGGEFYHYLAGEVGPDGITIAAYDDKGQQRDRFIIASR